jgi:hypothetical protein
MNKTRPPYRSGKYVCERYNKKGKRRAFSNSQWWASYMFKVTELLNFRYWQKKLATFNPLPIFPCKGSVTVTSY